MVKNIILAISILLNVAILAFAIWAYVMFNRGMFSYVMLNTAVGGFCGTELSDEYEDDFSEVFCGEWKPFMEKVSAKMRGETEVENPAPSIQGQEEEEETTPTEDTPTEPEEEVHTLTPGTFEYDEENYTYWGDFEVKGYMTTELVDESFCTENCKTYIAAFLHIMETENESIDNFISDNEGNAFVRESKIGIGCVEEDLVWRMNNSDKYGIKKYATSQETSTALSNSTEENPVIINVTRYLYTGGSGAPACYSHFAEVELIK